MRITVVAVGKRMPAWVTSGIDEYCRRLPRHIAVTWHEIALARRNQDASDAKLRSLEGEKILKAIPAGDRVVALDVRGKRLSTQGLAEALGDWQMSGDNFAVLIGGPDGLSEACLKRADMRWSLSDLTFPHPLVRVVLAEQLYRAWTITANHPYHRE